MGRWEEAQYVIALETLCTMKVEIEIDEKCLRTPNIHLGAYEVGDTKHGHIRDLNKTG